MGTTASSSPLIAMGVTSRARPERPLPYVDDARDFAQRNSRVEHRKNRHALCRKAVAGGCQGVTAEPNASLWRQQ